MTNEQQRAEKMAEKLVLELEDWYSGPVHDGRVKRTAKYIATQLREYGEERDRATLEAVASNPKYLTLMGYDAIKRLLTKSDELDKGKPNAADTAKLVEELRRSTSIPQGE